MLNHHIKQDIFLAFQTCGCLLLYESSAESSCMSFLHYFHAAISKHLSEKPKICLVLYGRLTQVGLYASNEHPSQATAVSSTSSVAFGRLISGSGKHSGIFPMATSHPTNDLSRAVVS